MKSKEKKLKNGKQQTTKRNFSPIIIIIVIFVLLIAFVGKKIIKQTKNSINTAYNDFINEQLEIEAPQDQIIKLAPLDEVGTKRISQIKENKGDTWTIAIYMVGSDLEDHDIDNLSSLNHTLLYDVAETNEINQTIKKKEALLKYQEELKSNGLDFANKLNTPEMTKESEDDEDNDNPFNYYNVPAGSLNIDKMLMADPSDNVKIVLQTGGARSWRRESINPNITQRFEIKNQELIEVDRLPLLDHSDKNTFRDFINFVESNYKSDHMILFLWNHGDGPFGYGYDNIFNNMLTLKDIKDALNEVLLANEDNPPFDVFVCDACYMGNVEVANYFKGFTKYLVASPEMIPGNGQNYYPVLNYLSNNPKMTTLDFCKNIVDTFINYYVSSNINLKDYLGESDEILSIIDVNKACELYKKYCDLTKKQLIDSANNINVLTKIGKAAKSSIKYGKEYFDFKNLIDISSYLKNLSKFYDIDLDDIINCANETIIYKRAIGYYKDAGGISIYFPHTMINDTGLYNNLKYINEVSLDENVNALYYYKYSGCLNEKFNNYTKEISGKAANILNISQFREFKNNDISLVNGNCEVNIDEDLKSSIQDNYMKLYFYDKNRNVYYNYGYRNCVDSKETGKLKTIFDNKWVTIDGIPLSVEIVNDSDDIIELRSKISKDDNYYLMFSVNKITNEYKIHGIDHISSYSAFINYREPDIIIDNTTIAPIYTVYDFENDSSWEEEGQAIKLTKNSKIELTEFNTEDFFTSIIIEDIRGDSYESKLINIK